ncbi:MAG: trypsin-like peptidase domain-containing protein, partial [Verrucomicrobiota bacterium]
YKPVRLPPRGISLMEGPCHGPRENPPDFVAVAAGLAAGVVKIENLGEDGKVLKTGTGFFASSDGTVVTCHHVVEGAKKIRVLTLTGAEFKNKGILMTDPKIDLAILEIEADGIAPFPLADDRSAVVGMPVAILGNPLGLSGSLSTGVVSAIRPVKGYDFPAIQVSAAVSSGSSGGPVVDSVGRLLGMVSAKMREGEALGFAIPVGLIRQSLQKARETPTRIASTSARRTVLDLAKAKYRPSPELAADPTWDEAKLPENASQRIAVLKRFASSYPDDSYLRIQIARAIKEDGDSEAAFLAFASIFKNDPSNRLALRGICEANMSYEAQIPFLRVGITSDSLNFNARILLSTVQCYQRDYLAAWLTATKGSDIAPYDLKTLSEGLDRLLGLMLHDDYYARDKETFAVTLEGVIDKVEKIIGVRGVASAAVRVLAEETPAALADFAALVESQPDIALPYLHELIEIGVAGRPGVTALFKAESGKKLLALRDAAVNSPSPLAEAYFLDPAAVDWRRGLLHSAIIDATYRVKMERDYDVVAPFDELAMIWLLVMGETGDFRTSILKPDMIARLDKLRTEYFRTRRQLAKLDESDKDGKPVTPILFTYWLAWEKDRLQELARVPATEGDSPPVASNWAPVLKDIKGIPSKTAAKESVREWIRSGEFRWDYYGKDVALQAAKAFEATAQ